MTTNVEQILNTWTDYFSAQSTQVLDNTNLKIWVVKEKSDLEISWVNIFEINLIKITETHWINWSQNFSIDIDGFQKYTEQISFQWNPEDLIYYPAIVSRTKSIILDTFMESTELKIRIIDESDRVAFDEMTSKCSDEDLDAGYVELDHSLVVGAFQNEKMISRASAYPFLNSKLIMDIGYISLIETRGKGAASKCLQLLNHKIIEQSKIPQIRVQPDLIGSIKVAERAQFQLAGTWKYDSQA